jgi:hypothetical protein
VGEAVDNWPQIEPLKAAIADAERRLAELRSQRNAVLVAMIRAGVSRRQIGSLWGVSNVAITHVVNRMGGTENTG